MPTYRIAKAKHLCTDTLTTETGLPVVEDISMLHKLDALCAAKGVLLIIKPHMIQKEFPILQEELSNIEIVNDATFEDDGFQTYEVMSETDGLISDYSSVAIDYLLLDKPIGYTLDDIDAYEEQRGFLVDNPKDYMPGTHIYDFKDLLLFI